jgi:Ca-activated chloride channel family protein
MENGTAIGDAIALAAARLHTVESTLSQYTSQSSTNFSIKSKIMILMTDGQNNSGKRAPLQAAKLAVEWGIKIYTVGIGGKQPIFKGSSTDPFGRRIITTADPVNEAELTTIANATGGRFFMAEDAAALKSIYQEIDRLERTEIHTLKSRNYHELFPYIARWALGLLVVEMALRTFIYVKIP